MKKISAKKLKALGGKIPFSTIASPRKAVRKSKRKPSEFARIYGSKARVEWVKSLPCAACGIVGFSENAHVAPPSEKGTGYKAGYEWIAPLCCERLATCELPLDGGGLGLRFIGCHKQYDEYRWAFENSHPNFDPKAEASKVQIAWLSIKGEEK